jgi:hypothetical protein
MKTTSIPTLIAWLSVCLLAASWGHTLDDQWQTIWAEIGAFGLTSAVGLGAIEKVRLAQADRVHNRELQARVESGLARLNEHSAAVDSINAAVRRLTEHAVKSRRAEVSATPRSKRRVQNQLLGDYPLEVTPVEDQQGPFDSHQAASISGLLRQISSQGVTFEHDAKFDTRIVLLTFKLSDEQRLTFVVDVMWTQPTPAGFTSGGAVLAVGVPSETTANEPDEIPLTV